MWRRERDRENDTERERYREGERKRKKDTEGERKREREMRLGEIQRMTEMRKT